ncbi:Sof1-like protein [Dillenia turbinata]|uniref:Sof1-like protein n=1 Tax=Dillenia turbinata TaxID=194707 RepID=A0AAN8V105_9MAGN
MLQRSEQPSVARRLLEISIFRRLRHPYFRRLGQRQDKAGRRLLFFFSFSLSGCLFSFSSHNHSTAVCHCRKEEGSSCINIGIFISSRRFNVTKERTAFSGCLCLAHSSYVFTEYQSLNSLQLCIYRDSMRILIDFEEDVTATEGLFDNPYEQEVASIVIKALQFNLKPACFLYLRHRHLPKTTYKAAALTRTMTEAKMWKEERKAPSEPGTVQTEPLVPSSVPPEALRLE